MVWEQSNSIDIHGTRCEVARSQIDLAESMVPLLGSTHSKCHVSKSKLIRVFTPAHETLCARPDLSSDYDVIPAGLQGSTFGRQCLCFPIGLRMDGSLNVNFCESCTVILSYIRDGDDCKSTKYIST